MKPRSRVGVALVVSSAAVLIAGCGPGSTSGSARHHAAPSSSATPTGDSPAGLKARLVAGAAAERSAHVSFYLGPTDGGAKDDGSTYEMSGDGTETFSGGQPRDLDMALRLLGGVDARLVRSGNQLFVTWPPDLDKAAKPWFVVSANSSNEFVRDQSASLQQYAQLGSPDRYISVTGQATRLDKAGTEQLDGASVTHYRMSVPTAALSRSSGTQASSPLGTAVTVELWVDDRARIRKVSYQLGHPVAMVLTVLLGEFDAPTAITAPPPSEVNPS